MWIRRLGTISLAGILGLSLAIADDPPSRKPPTREAPPQRSSPPGKQEPPPSRQAPPPARETPPPSKQTPPPARQTPPPAKQEPPPARQTPPPARETPPPSRQTPPPSRQDPPTRTAPPPSRNDGKTGNQNERPPVRNDADRANTGNQTVNPPGRIRNDGRNYGSNNNLITQASRPDANVLNRAPIDVFSGSLANQVLREEKVRAVRNSPIRVGYYHYDRGWCDDYFWFPHYVFNPYQTVCHISPWYYYPYLPGYVNRQYVTILTINLGPFQGSYYTWRPIRSYSSYYSYNDLDYAIQDLVDAFERQDRRAISRLVPLRSRVDILIDGRYAYSMDSDAFYELMLDNIYQSDTRRYNIVSVRRNRGEVEIVARHDFVDPWGRSDSVYHEYRLRESGRGYEITAFGSSYYRY